MHTTSMGRASRSAVFKERDEMVERFPPHVTPMTRHRKRAQRQRFKRNLGSRLEALYDQMQRPEVREATERALQASPKDLGAAAVRAATRKR
ncbi:MAG: hypothetical protein Q8K82_25625 [Gemmatimonadaceae bacterium]|nr:hypothetical protein [Gemmatimonadaceae bacterium]